MGCNAFRDRTEHPSFDLGLSALPHNNHITRIFVCVPDNLVCRMAYRNLCFDFIIALLSFFTKPLEKIFIMPRGAINYSVHLDNIDRFRRLRYRQYDDIDRCSWTHLRHVESKVKGLIRLFRSVKGNEYFLYHGILLLIMFLGLRLRRFLMRMSVPVRQQILWDEKSVCNKCRDNGAADDGNYKQGILLLIYNAVCEAKEG